MPKLQQLKVQVGSTAGTGKEPTWDNFNETHRQAEVIHAFNFYNYHFDHKTASLLVADYLLQNDRMDEHKKWAKVPAYGVKKCDWMVCTNDYYGLSSNRARNRSC